MPSPYGLNSSTNRWRCVPLAPGSSNGQTGNWMSVATKNCDDIANNSCQDIVCNWDGNYDGKPGRAEWVGSRTAATRVDPRVVSLFVIPYQSLKGVTGSNEEAPVLGFASFYVMDWEGSNAQKSDQCPDPDFDGVTLPRAARRDRAGCLRRVRRLRVRARRPQRNLRRGPVDSLPGNARPLICR